MASGAARVAGPTGGGIGVEHTVGLDPHQHLGGDIAQPGAEGDGVTSGVEDEQWRRAAGLAQGATEPADLVDGGVGGIGAGWDPGRIQRGGPAVGAEGELGDPLVVPSRHDGLAGGVAGRRVVEAPLGTGRLSADEAKLYKEWITNDRRMRRVIQQMRKIAAGAGGLLVEQAHR
jgi:hypothetical protein